jgi:hypothetical protein
VDKNKDYFKFKYSPMAAILGYAKNIGKKESKPIKSLSEL